MSRRPNTTRPETPRRLERRDQRQARQPSAAPRPRRTRPTTTQTRSRRRLLGNVSSTTLVVIGGVALMLALIAYVLWQSGETGSTEAAWQRAQMNDDPSLPGRYIPPHPGRDMQLGTQDDRAHFADGIEVPICTPEQLAQNRLADPGYGAAGVCYTSNPPTSGPHGQRPVAFGIRENPAPKENLVHSMEHGAVIVWYNSSNQQAIDQLKAVVQNALDRRRLVVMTPYPGMEAETIALTAWTRLDKFPVSELTEKRVRDFIEAHQRRFNPEGF